MIIGKEFEFFLLLLSFFFFFPLNFRHGVFGRGVVTSNFSRSLPAMEQLLLTHCELSADGTKCLLFYSHRCVCVCVCVGVGVGVCMCVSVCVRVHATIIIVFNNIYIYV